MINYQLDKCQLNSICFDYQHHYHIRCFCQSLSDQEADHLCGGLYFSTTATFTSTACSSWSLSDCLGVVVMLSVGVVLLINCSLDSEEVLLVA